MDDVTASVALCGEHWEMNV